MKKGFSLNRFNAKPQNEDKPLSVYDSANKTSVSFPVKKVKNFSTSQSDIASTIKINKQSGVSQDHFIIKQIEKDVRKVKEQSLKA